MSENIEEKLKKLTDSNDELREEAAASLVGTDNPKALVPLMTASKDPHPGVKYFAKKALKTLQDSIAKNVGLDEVSSIAEIETSVIPEVPDPIDELIASPIEVEKKEEPVEDSSYNFDKMFEAMAQPDKPEDTGINEETRSKINKIQDIAQSGDVTKLPTILKILESEKDKYLIATLIKAIGKMGNRSHMPNIIKFLGDDDTRIVANCIESLEMLGNPKCVEPMLKLIGHGDNRVRANAMKAIWTYAHTNPLANKLIMDRLKEMIFSSKSQMRESAIYVLGEIGSEAALDLVSLSMNDSVESVRDKALEAIKKIESKMNSGTSIIPEIVAEPDAEPIPEPVQETAAQKEEILQQLEKDPAEEVKEDKNSEEAKKERAKKKKERNQPVKKPAFKRKEKVLAKSVTADKSDDIDAPREDGDVISVEKNKTSKRKTVMIGIEESGSSRNPMKTVLIASLVLSLVFSSLIGGLYFYTGGNFTKIGIPLDLSSGGSSADEEEEEIERPSWEEHYSDGLEYFEEGFYMQAIKEFKMVLKDNSSHDSSKEKIAESHLKRGEEYSNLEIYSKAAQEFRESLKWTQKDSNIYKRANSQLQQISNSIK